MIDLLAWLGVFLLSACGIPQAWKAWKTKSSGDISWGFLCMWGIGELCMLPYASYPLQPILLINYTCNLICIAIIVRYKFH